MPECVSWIACAAKILVKILASRGLHVFECLYWNVLSVRHLVHFGHAIFSFSMARQGRTMALLFPRMFSSAQVGAANV